MSRGIADLAASWETQVSARKLRFVLLQQLKFDRSYYEIHFGRGKDNRNSGFPSGRFERRARPVWGGGFDAP
jgi:hypothetical protein